MTENTSASPRGQADSRSVQSIFLSLFLLIRCHRAPCHALFWEYGNANFNAKTPKLQQLFSANVLHVNKSGLVLIPRFCLAPKLFATLYWQALGSLEAMPEGIRRKNTQQSATTRKDATNVMMQGSLTWGCAFLFCSLPLSIFPLTRSGGSSTRLIIATAQRTSTIHATRQGSKRLARFFGSVGSRLSIHKITWYAQDGPMSSFAKTKPTVHARIHRTKRQDRCMHVCKRCLRRAFPSLLV